MFAMRSLVSLLVGATWALAAVAQTPTQSTEGENESQRIEGIAAIVNDSPISYSDVRERARLLLLSLGAQPTQEDILQITSQALQQLIDEKLQLQEAAEWEVGVAPEEIAASIEDMAAQSGLTREQLYQQLMASGINPASLEEQMRAEIAWRRVMQGVYGSRIRISENQVNEELKQMRNSASKTQYLLSEIFLYAPDQQSKAQAMEAARSIRAQILQGAPFQVAAQRLSSAPTAAANGDMGWVSLEDINSTVAEAIEVMPGPGISDPIMVADGIYLMAMRAKRDPEEAVVQVSLTRLLARDGDQTALDAAMSEITSCEDIEAVANASDNLQSASLGRVAMTELADDAVARIEAAAVGAPTTPFEASNGLAVMYVCDRTDAMDNLPSPIQVENSLFGRQLNMISDRELRNLRREATIIQRDER